jgi:hypothetical protein
MKISPARSRLVKPVLLLYLITVWGVFVFLNAGMWGNFWEVDKDYCIPVSPAEPHDYKIDENDACLIDWWVVAAKPGVLSLALFAIFFFILTLPALSLYRRR